MSAIINNLDFLSFKTEGQIAKEFKEQTGKSRTSAIFMAYMKELKEVSEPTYFNTNIRYYHKDDIDKVFKPKTDYSKIIKVLEQHLDGFIEWATNRGLDNVPYVLKKHQVLAIDAEVEKWNKVIGNLQRRYNISISLLNDKEAPVDGVLIFQKN